MRRAIRTHSLRRVAGMLAAVVLIVAIAVASGCGQERSGSFKLNPSKASSAGIGF
ncbi:MAG: hypothetical protein OXR64_08960 [Chloroflexota bacterium]|nr:hypothetical protein [Chloroflexota bacterium]MDE2919961.1 hypothetical protein [Chloroflexota bacterium]